MFNRLFKNHIIEELKSNINRLADRIYQNELKNKLIEYTLQEVVETNGRQNICISNLKDKDRYILNRLDTIERVLANTNSNNPIVHLKRQVQCGVIGHGFKLECICEKDISTVRSECLIGMFKCSKCGLEITRQLKPSEVTAAKKLGMIK